MPLRCVGVVGADLGDMLPTDYNSAFCHAAVRLGGHRNRATLLHRPRHCRAAAIHKNFQVGPCSAVLCAALVRDMLLISSGGASDS